MNYEPHTRSTSKSISRAHDIAGFEEQWACRAGNQPPSLEEPPLVKSEFGFREYCAASVEASHRLLFLRSQTAAQASSSFAASARTSTRLTTEAPLKTILIASGMPSEGKSFVAANLAMSLARNSVNNILLIDGDMRRPTLHELLGAPNSPGLSDYLEGTVDLMDIMQRDRSPKLTDDAGVDSISNLTFIPSGKSSDNSSELVANHRIEELIATVSPHFNWILIDSPPVAGGYRRGRPCPRRRCGFARRARSKHALRSRSAHPGRLQQIAHPRLCAQCVKDAPRKGSYNYGYYYYTVVQKAPVNAKSGKG